MTAGGRRAIFLLAALTVLFSSTGSRALSGLPGAAGEGAETSGEMPVLFVADGDTVLVSRRGKREWVRLLRIDTPEREEKGYREAREALQAMIGSREVRLSFEDPGSPERDVHGRLLAYIFFEERNVNIEMVRLGWSPFWIRYGEGRFAPLFRLAEDEARREGRGLWSRER